MAKQVAVRLDAPMSVIVTLVLAAPVAAPAAAAEMGTEADEVIILAVPRRFRSVGQCYRSFGQLTDADVLALLT